MWLPATPLVSLFLATAPALPPPPSYYFTSFIGDAAAGYTLATTPDATNLGAGGMIWKGVGCGNKPMIFWRKGLRTFPWASESHVQYGDISTGYWLSLDDLRYYEDTGNMYLHRVYRDLATLRKGVMRWRVRIPVDGDDLDVPPFAIETWDNHCLGTSQTPEDGPVSSTSSQVMVNYATIYDCRNVAPANVTTRGRPVTVDVWENLEDWAPDNGERYHFARWRDPLTGVLHGVGLIRWEAWGTNYGCPGSHTACTGGAVPYVVSGVTPSIPCITCPDPGRP